MQPQENVLANLTLLVTNVNIVLLDFTTFQTLKVTLLYFKNKIVYYSVIESIIIAQNVHVMPKVLLTLAVMMLLENVLASQTL